MDAQQQALRQGLLEELEWATNLGASRLDITVASDGVVTLTGVVEGCAQKGRLERAVKRVNGVRAVVNHVDVKLPGWHDRADVQLAQAVVQALERDPQVPRERIQACVCEGWVRLQGEVDWYYQQAAAEEAAHRLTGVKGIVNLITVTPELGCGDAAACARVRQGIRAALERGADPDAANIEVETHEGEVVLRGRVRSWAVREAAEAAAWAAPGVVTVDDRLQVDSLTSFDKRHARSRGFLSAA